MITMVSYLICPGRGLPCLLLESGDDGVQAVSLALQRLHLLTDRVHGCEGREDEGRWETLNNFTAFSF